MFNLSQDQLCERLWTVDLSQTWSRALTRLPFLFQKGYDDCWRSLVVLKTSAVNAAGGSIPSVAVLKLHINSPNKSLEATRVGHRSSATRFTVIGRGCLSFFR